MQPGLMVNVTWKTHPSLAGKTETGRQSSRGRGTPSSPEPPCPWGSGVKRGHKAGPHVIPSVDTTPAVHGLSVFPHLSASLEQAEVSRVARWVLAQPLSTSLIRLVPREEEMKEITCFTLKLRRRTWKRQICPHLLEKTARECHQDSRSQAAGTEQPGAQGANVSQAGFPEQIVSKCCSPN